MKKLTTLIVVFWYYTIAAQTISNLPIWNKQESTKKDDWLIEKAAAKAKLYRTKDGKLVFSNGFVARIFSLKPDSACVGIDLLSNIKSFGRSVRPEAEVEMGGLKFRVGGLTGQPNQNYLLLDWLEKMEADPASFKLVDLNSGNIKARFPWKKRMGWMRRDMEWPLPGKELVFRYRLDESASTVDSEGKWELPNMTLETDYNFGGRSDESLTHSSISWNRDTHYKTQFNFERKMPCLLEVYPKYGPDQTMQVGQTFESFRIGELSHNNCNREHKGLENRRMMRSLASWSSENIILMHVRGSKDELVKKTIDPCAEVGFETEIMTPGSGFDIEDVSSATINRMQKLAGYAHSKGILLGGLMVCTGEELSRPNLTCDYSIISVLTRLPQKKLVTVALSLTTMGLIPFSPIHFSTTTVQVWRGKLFRFKEIAWLLTICNGFYLPTWENRGVKMECV